MRNVTLISLTMLCALLAAPRIHAQRSRGRSATTELAACRRSGECVAIVGPAALETARWADVLGSAPVRTVRFGPYRRRGDADVHLAVFDSRAARDRFVDALRRIGAEAIGNLGMESVLPIDAQGVILRVVRVGIAPGDATVRARVEAIARRECATAEVSAMSQPNTLEIDFDWGCGPIVDVRGVAAQIARDQSVRFAEPARMDRRTARR